MTRSFHVAENGRDSNPGTKARPFATLEQARRAVRRLKRDHGLPAGGVVVSLGAGIYSRTATLNLTRQDSGEAGHPIVYRAARNGTACLSGGRRLDPSSFLPVEDARVLARLPSRARRHVLQCDLRAQGIAELGRLEPQGYTHHGAIAWPELFFNNTPLPLAGWPNRGFARMGKVMDPGVPTDRPPDARHVPDVTRLRACFEFPDKRLKRWAQAKDAWIYGFYRYDWADEYLPVAAIDARRKRITLGMAPRHGMETGRRFRVLNLIEELDRPGEWYVDRETTMLYLWPLQPMSSARVVLSSLPSPLIALKNASHVTLRGLVLEAGRDCGIRIVGGRANRISRCVLRNLGTDGVRIGGRAWGGEEDGGRDNGVTDCEIYNTGGGGVQLIGGDRRRLKPAGNFVTRCHIHHFSRACRCYRPAVNIRGVGNRVAHNCFHDAPHSAILLGGNDHVIEFNEIHHVVLDTDDAGAFYMGRNPSEQGVIIRHNYFHDLGSRLGHGTAAVYLDDGASGARVYGNIFQRTGNPGRAGFGAVFVHGGKDNTFENNLFVLCRQVAGVINWGEPFWRDFLRGKTRFGAIDKKLYGEVNICCPPHSTRYPGLAQLRKDPGRNRFIRNVACGCGRFLATAGQDEKNNLCVARAPAKNDCKALQTYIRRHLQQWIRAIRFKPLRLAQVGP